MNGDQLNELKQFITDTVSAQIVALDDKLMRRMDAVEDKMDNMEARLTNRIDGLEVKTRWIASIRTMSTG
jgi:hypothetical protein